MRTRDVELDRIGARREQQLVVALRLPVVEHDALALRVDRRHAHAELQPDPMLGEELAWAQRQPLLRRVAGEVIFGEIGPIDGRRGIGPDHDELAAVTLAS